MTGDEIGADVSSPDSDGPGTRWMRHYEEAARRRRARGWHRRADSNNRAYDSGAGRRRDARIKLYVGAGALFLALTLVAIFLPR